MIKYLLIVACMSLSLSLLPSQQPPASYTIKALLQVKREDKRKINKYSRRKQRRCTDKMRKLAMENIYNKLTIKIPSDDETPLDICSVRRSV